MRSFGEINIYEILSSKDATEPIGPTLFAGPYMTPGKVNYFHKILKIHKKNITKSANFFGIVFYCTNAL